MLDIAAGNTQATRTLVVYLKGKIDSRTAGDFNLFMDELVSSGHCYLILQAQRLDHISSAGISSIIQLWKRLDYHRGAVVLAGPSEEIKMLFSFTNLDQHIPIFQKIEEAESYLMKQTDFKRRSQILGAKRQRSALKEPEALDRYGASARASLVARPDWGGRQRADRAEQRQDPLLPAMGSEIAASYARPVGPVGPVGIESSIDPNPNIDPSLNPSNPEAESKLTSEESLSSWQGESDSRRQRESARGWQRERDNRYKESPYGYESERRATILKCRNCALPLRVQAAGKHICPGCGDRFTATEADLSSASPASSDLSSSNSPSSNSSSSDLSSTDLSSTDPGATVTSSAEPSPLASADLSTGRM